MEIGRVRRERVSQCAFPSESVSRPQLEANATSTTFSQPLMRSAGGAEKQVADREGKAFSISGLQGFNLRSENNILD